MEIAEALEIMQATPAALAELVETDNATLGQRGADGWTAKEYIGHLCDASEWWDERARRTLLEDRPTLPGYDQEEVARLRGHQEADLRPAVAAQAARRAQTLALLREAPAAAWERIGVHEERGPMTLREIVLTIARHERTHLDDISRVVAQTQGGPRVGRVNLALKFGLIQEYWQPKIVGELNDSHVKLVKAKGEFDWHHHDNEDELFLVLKGTLVIRLRDRAIELREGELTIIPRGVEHQPFAAEECHIMLLEPQTTLNTGNVQSEKTVEAPQWI